MKRIISVFSLYCCLLSCSNEEKISVFTENQQPLVQTEEGFLSKSTAQEVATLFYSNLPGSKQTRNSKVIKTVEPINDDTNTPLAYIVNYEEGGWVIVSTIKDYYPILAFSDDNQFILTHTDINDGLKMWLNETIQAIESSEKLDSQTSSQIAIEWLKYTPQVQELKQAGIPGGNSPEAIMCRNRLKQLNETYYHDGWSFRTLASLTNVTLSSKVYNIADQCGSPYEYTIIGLKDASNYSNIGPLITTEWEQENGFNDLCPDKKKAGCVAIAMAQIMKFHKYPTYFEWDNMPDTYATYASQFLIVDIGKIVGIDYGHDSSGATPSEALQGFKSYGYNAVLKDHTNSDVVFEIKNFKRPVYMRGKRSLTKGHAWVCDGLIQNLSEYKYYAEYMYNGSYDNFGETSIDLPGGVVEEFPTPTFT